MTCERNSIELVAPARDLQCGIEAINHGADAVYIGGPAFSARAAAGNPVNDIEKLAAHAHTYGARVFVALNTLVFDSELEDARRQAFEVYEAGADALILQDMGLLRLGLPPIPLHASTQCDNQTPEKVRFLENSGFSQVVLARELDVGEIAGIAAATKVRLECFVFGAVCVSMSGLCHLSLHLAGRSANRGECAQPCRLPMTLYGPGGKKIAADRHLLCLKDMDRTDRLGELVNAGVSAFKIEGRLKDVGYVKNVTAYVRRKLDAVLSGMPEKSRASAGRPVFFFEPDPEKTFNRGLTEYFIHGRGHDAENFDTPKFRGPEVGRVVAVGPGYIEIEGKTDLHNGDGLTFFGRDDILTGLRINKAEGGRIWPRPPYPTPLVGAPVYRNHDEEFETLLKGRSAVRKIAVRMRFGPTVKGFSLQMESEDGFSVTAEIPAAKELAQNRTAARERAASQLGKLGNTPYEAADVEIEGEEAYFVPASQLNELRRKAVKELDEARLLAFRAGRSHRSGSGTRIPGEGWGIAPSNAVNREAFEFYREKGFDGVLPGLDRTRATKGEILMTSVHCLRRSFDICGKGRRDGNAENLTLRIGGEDFTLEFDCVSCLMRLRAKD